MLHCMRLLDAREAAQTGCEAGRRAAAHVTGHVDVFLDPAVTLLPHGVAPGATVSVRRVRVRAGPLGHVSARAGRETLVSVDVPPPEALGGFVPPRVTSLPFPGEGGPAGAWRVGRRVGVEYEEEGEKGKPVKRWYPALITAYDEGSETPFTLTFEQGDTEQVKLLEH